MIPSTRPVSRNFSHLRHDSRLPLPYIFNSSNCRSLQSKKPRKLQQVLQIMAPSSPVYSPLKEVDTFTDDGSMDLNDCTDTHRKHRRRFRDVFYLCAPVLVVALSSFTLGLLINIKTQGAHPAPWCKLFLFRTGLPKRLASSLTWIILDSFRIGRVTKLCNKVQRQI